MAWKRGKKLSPVTEEQAEGDIEKTYSEIRSALGITFIPVAFQMLASEPRYLAEHWKTISSIVATKCFRKCTDRLRADAYTRVHSYFKIPDLNKHLQQLQFSEGAKEELSYVVDLFHYLNPALLLIFTIQAHAFEGPVGNSNADRSAGHYPSFEHNPVFMEEFGATPSAKKVFDEAKQVTGLPLVSSDLRALGRWSEFLEEYWQLARGMIRSPLFSECQRGVEDTAATVLRELPGPVELSLTQLAEAGIPEDEISSIVRATENMVHGFAMLSLNISIAKIGLEGGNIDEINDGAADSPLNRAPQVA